MKKALAFVVFVVAVAVIIDKASVGGTLVEQTNSASSALTKQVDNLLTTNKLTIDVWSIRPVFSKTWVNGEAKNESYIVAQFTNLDNKRPLNEAQLTAFSEQLYATISADTATASSFQGMRVLFENRVDYFLFKSSTNFNLTFLFGESEQKVAAN